MGKEELGFSATAISKMIASDDWVNNYSKEWKRRSEELKRADIRQGKFESDIKDELYKAFEKEISEEDRYIKKCIAEWMQISHLKALSVFSNRSVILNKIESALATYENFQDKSQNKTLEESRLPESNIMCPLSNLPIFYEEISINNALGTSVSEMFYAAEAMLRVVCIGSCLDFATKSIMPKEIVQHDAIYKTLKRLSRDASEKVSCKLCTTKSTCDKNNGFVSLARIYEILYHLRAIKDYKRDFYFNNDFTSFFALEFIPKGLDVLSDLDRAVNNIYSGYMNFPYTLEELFKSVSKN